MAGKIYVATESFTVALDGVEHKIGAGKTRVREGHPLLKGREMYFKELDVQYDVERATKAPGEKRETASKSSKPDKPKSE